MKSCTFFGHRDCPDAISITLRAVLMDLIITQGVTMFYVGNQGRFDALVYGVLRDLKQEYPHIHYRVVLANMPTKENPFSYSETLLPEGIECIHPRYRVSWWNVWMLRQAQFVVTCITHPWGGAARFAAQAQRMGKQIIHL